MDYIKYGFLVVSLLVAGYAGAESAKELINYPPVNDITLANGLRLMLIEHHEQPTVSYRVVVKSGRIDGPLGKEGLADLTARLLQEGTLSKTSDQIADKIAEIGGKLNISSQSNYTTFGLDVLSQYSSAGFDILADIILNPAFPSQGIKRVKKELVSDVDLELTDNYKIASNHSRLLLFGAEHPLGRANTKKSLEGINLSDIRDFYQMYFCPNNSMVLVIGDFSKERMLAQVTEKFGSWKQAKVKQRVQTRPDFAKKGKFRVVDKPDMTQAVIYLNQWAISSRSKDYYEYLLANYVLGGSGSSSRLVKAVRAEGGKTYGIGSRYDMNFDYGILGISTSTRNQEMLNTYQLIQTELKKLVDKGITEEELVKAKTYMAGAIPMQLETPASVADKILKAVMRGFTIDDLSKEVIYYNNVTADNVNHVIKEYIKPENLNVVIVGDVRKIEKQLTQIGVYEKVYYKDPLVK